MSYGFEYNSGGGGYGGGYGGGFDPMGGADVFAEGGGFMNSSSATPEKKSKDKNSIIPLTCKQFMDASSENGTFLSDDKELHVVKIVGYVEGLEDHSTNTVYRINDGTGSVDCKYWTPKEKFAKDMIAMIVANSYVRVFGNPSEYEGKRSISVYDIRPIDDFNEVTYHILDAQYSSLQNAKGPIKVPKGSLNSPIRGVPSNNSTSSSRHHTTPSAQMGSMNINNASSRQQVVGTVKNEAVKLIAEAIRTAQHTDFGYNVKGLPTFLAQRGVNQPWNQIEGIITFLHEEGNIYYTVEGECVKLTDDSWTG